MVAAWAIVMGRVGPFRSPRRTIKSTANGRVELVNVTTKWHKSGSASARGHERTGGVCQLSVSLIAICLL